MCTLQADSTNVLEVPGPHDVSAAAASFGDSQDWMPFVGFSVCNFLSLLTSVFSLLLLLSLHLMQYSTVFHAHKIDDPKEQEHRDLLTFSLVSAALGTLIFSILCLLLAAHFAIMIRYALRGLHAPCAASCPCTTSSKAGVLVRAQLLPL